MAAYIDRPTGYDLALAGPFRSQGANARVYVLQANVGALTNTCNRYLNSRGGPDIYLPLGGLAVLAMVNIANVTAGDPTLGSMHEIDCAFMFPVLRFVAGFPIPVEVGVFMPYLWVDNDWPVITGREVLGFRKEIGTSFTNGDDRAATSGADLQHIDCWVVPARGNALSVQRIVEIDPAALAQTTTAPWASAAEALGQIIQAAQGFVPAVGFLTSILSGLTVTSPIVFLKQFRDERNQALACYQRVILADCGIPLGTLHGGLLPGRPQVRITSYESHPVALELGIGTMGMGAQTLTSEFAFEAQFDFAVGVAR